MLSHCRVLAAPYSAVFFYALHCDYLVYLDHGMKNILIWMTQTLNTFTGGHPDHSFSGRTGYRALRIRKIQADFPCCKMSLGQRFVLVSEKVIDWIFWQLIAEKHHCYHAIEWYVVGDSPNKYPRPE